MSKSTKEKQAISFQKFLTTSCLISYGLINGICNCLVFMFCQKNYMGSSIPNDELLVVFCLTAPIMTFIMALCALGPIKKSIVSGMVLEDAFSTKDRFFYKIAPKNYWLQIAVTLLCNAIVFIPIALVLLSIFYGPIAFPLAVIFSFLFTAIGGAFNGYIFVHFVWKHFKQTSTIAAIAK